MRQRVGERRRPSGAQWRALAARALVFGLVWIVVAVPVSFMLFLNSSQSTVIASHDAVVRPTLDGYATLDLGPYLPNVRYPTSSTLGAQIDLGKTNLTTYEALIERYAFIGSQPDGEIARLRATLTGLAFDSAVSGGLVALAGPILWVLLGRRRRGEIRDQVTMRRAAIACLAGAVIATVAVRPWDNADEMAPKIVWQSIGAALPDVPIPEDAGRIQVEGGLMTGGTKRLAESAFDTYTRSLNFYTDVRERAEQLGPSLRQPAEDERVALLVSDRHDNVGMDKVARAIADAGGASILLDAGDDTSTGGRWEAFSLESLNQAFVDFDDRFAIAGNHDSGDFVSEYLSDLGFTTLDAEVVDVDGIQLMGVHDPRSSGLGTWRDTPGPSFATHSAELTDLACEQEADGNRINTLLVHDANSAAGALRRGCVDLVLGGHIHEQLGPTRVVGENGRAGYTYTNGTTGGAAFALAIGSKLRRNAQVTLVTYREGRPVGIQPVTVRTVGDFVIGEYVELDLTVAQTLRGPDDVGAPDADNDPSSEVSP